MRCNSAALKGEKMSETITLKEIYVSALKALNTHIGGEPLNANNIEQAFDDPQYSDKLMAMFDSVQRGLLFAEQSPLPNEDMNADLVTLGVPYVIALSLPLYIKYELYQTEDYRQALLARDEYEAVVKRYLNQSPQTEAINVFEGMYD